MDVHDTRRGELFPDRPHRRGGRGGEKTKKCFDIARLDQRLEAKKGNAAGVEGLREFLRARGVDLLLPVNQAVTGDAEDDIASWSAQIVEAAIDQIERSGQGGMAGRVGGEILPAE